MGRATSGEGVGSRTQLHVPSVAFTPGNIAALRIDTTDGSALSTLTSARVSIDEFTGGTTAAATRVQSVVYPGLCALSGNAFEGRLALSFSAAALSFGCYYLNPGNAALTAYAQRQIVTIGTDGTFSLPGAAVLSSSATVYSGPSVFSAAQDALGYYYVGAGAIVARNSTLAYAPSQGGAVAGYAVIQGNVTKVALFAGTVYACVRGTGIFRLPVGAALVPAPLLATSCGGTCVDFVFQSAQICKYTRRCTLEDSLTYPLDALGSVGLRSLFGRVALHRRDLASERWWPLYRALLRCCD